MRVTVLPDSVGVRVHSYKISGGGQSCEILPTSQPLTCMLTGLKAATEYTVGARTCITETLCSEPSFSKGWTEPNGNFQLTSALGPLIAMEK